LSIFFYSRKSRSSSESNVLRDLARFAAILIMKKIYKIDNVVHGLNRIRTDTPARRVHLSRIIHSLIMRWLMRMSVYFLLALLQYSEPVQRERQCTHFNCVYARLSMPEDVGRTWNKVRRVDKLKILFNFYFFQLIFLY